MQPPMVGRDRELRRLIGLIEDAKAGKGVLVLVSGEAGVGKSRLAEEFGKKASERGCSLLIGRCVPGIPNPYLPFQDAFQDFEERPGAKTRRHARLIESLKRAAPEVVEAAPVVGGLLKATATVFKEYREVQLHPKVDQGHTLHATLKLLRGISSKQPVVIILEDLQWVDSASAQLLHFLARNFRGLRVLLVGTYRSEELAGEGRETVHPLIEILRLMRREGICHEMSLDRLTLEETGEAIRGMLSGHTDPKLVRQIMDESEGNPLFAVETVRLLLQTNALTREEGFWKSKTSTEIRIPDTVREVVLRRIDRLRKQDRHLLEYAAVAGESFRPRVLEKALGLDPLHLLETLESLEKEFALVRADENGYRFSHEKICRVMYELISPPRRRELHRVVGEVLESQSDERLHPELAHHFRNSGDNVKWLKYSLLAGKYSMERAAFREAIMHFESALDAAGMRPNAVEARRQALEGLGDANAFLGQYQSAFRLFEDSLELSTEPRDRARLLVKRVECGFVDGLTDKKALDEAEACVGVEEVVLGRIKRLRGSIAIWAEGAYDEGERFLQEAEKIFTKIGALSDLNDTLSFYSLVHLSRWRVNDALENTQRVLGLCRQLRLPDSEIWTASLLGDIYRGLGLHQESLESYERACRIAEEYGEYGYLSWMHAAIALVYASVDDLESADRAASKARGYLQKYDPPGLGPFVCSSVLVAYADLRLGRIEEGESLWKEARGVLVKLPASNVILRILVTFVEAEILAAKLEWKKSRECFERSIQITQGTDSAPLIEPMLHVRYGVALQREGETLEAKEQFLTAKAEYEKLGNIQQTQRVGSLLASFT